MLPTLRQNLVEVLRSVAPIIGLICVLQLVLVQAPFGVFLQFLAGAVLIVVGMLLLFIGVDLGILPMGRFIGAELPKRGSIALILAVGLAMGFATTVAEPDVLVLSSQVDRVTEGRIPEQLVLYVMAAGVALFVAAAMARIVYGVSMRLLLTVAYALVILLSFVAPADLVPLAYDAGSVTTGVLTTPVVIALAGGLSAVLAGRSAVSDGFGLLGFSSIGPIILIMLLGIMLR